jgi:S1-C subfamily serine protease
LQFVRGVGTQVTAAGDGSPFAAAGVAAGDIIVRAGGVASPTPAQVRAALRSAPAGSFVLLVLRRGDTQHVTAVRTSGPSDVTTR